MHRVGAQMVAIIVINKNTSESWQDHSVGAKVRFCGDSAGSRSHGMGSNLL